MVKVRQTTSEVLALSDILGSIVFQEARATLITNQKNISQKAIYDPSSLFAVQILKYNFAHVFIIHRRL